MEWATRTKAHLMLVLQKDPTRKVEYVDRYRSRFPTDDLSDVVPATPAKKKDRVVPGPKMRVRPVAIEDLPKESGIDVQPEWSFYLTFDANSPGQKLPGDKGQFMEVLRATLQGEDYHSINPAIVYDKLQAVGGMEVQHRQEIKKVTDGEFAGCKIVRTGKKHRLLVSIDEEARIMRFTARPRKEAYGGH